MKKIVLALALGFMSTTALAYPYRERPPYHHDDGALLATLTAWTYTAFLITVSHEIDHHKLMVDASPVAADYLANGQGLDNPILQAAMVSAYQTHPEAQSFEDLASVIIEEAN